MRHLRIRLPLLAVTVATQSCFVGVGPERGGHHHSGGRRYDIGHLEPIRTLRNEAIAARVGPRSTGQYRTTAISQDGRVGHVQVKDRTV
jgi:hypothetical protein